VRIPEEPILSSRPEDRGVLAELVEKQILFRYGNHHTRMFSKSVLKLACLILPGGRWTITPEIPFPGLCSLH